MIPSCIPLRQPTAMFAHNECVETVKKVMAKVMHEKDALVARLNAMNKRIEEEKDLVAKVRLKVEWAEEKERSVKAMNTIVASLQRALAEDDMGETAPAARSTHGSTASREASDSGNVSNVSDASSVVTRPHGASSQSFTHTRASLVDRNQADFERTIAKIYQDLSLEASHRSSPVTPDAPSTSPLPARLNRDDGGETVYTPASNNSSGTVRRLPTEAARRLSTEAARLPQQVRKSLSKRVQRVSASMLQRVGWNPVLQESQHLY
ncbi:hypothetical protein T484DRAFT_1972526 [Baffinella frigidus]|nr:hypothetical protein T484DRAFT_1972526 [Cryptophyta sp. CCMP2293]